MGPFQGNKASILSCQPPLDRQPRARSGGTAIGRTAADRSSKHTSHSWGVPGRLATVSWPAVLSLGLRRLAAQKPCLPLMPTSSFSPQEAESHSAGPPLPPLAGASWLSVATEASPKAPRPSREGPAEEAHALGAECAASPSNSLFQLYWHWEGKWDRMA